MMPIAARSNRSLTYLKSTRTEWTAFCLRPHYDCFLNNLKTKSGWRKKLQAKVSSLIITTL